MTDMQKRLLTILANGREMTFGDIKARAKMKGYRLGPDKDVHGAMSGLLKRGVVTSMSVKEVATYQFCRETVADILARSKA